MTASPILHTTHNRALCKSKARVPLMSSKISVRLSHASNSPKDLVPTRLAPDDTECMTFTTFSSLYNEHVLSNKSLILARVCTPDGRGYYYYAPLFVRLIYRKSSSESIVRLKIRNPLTNTFLASTSVELFSFSDENTMRYLGGEEEFKDGLLEYIRENALEPEDCELMPFVEKRERSRSDEVERDGSLRFFMITIACSVVAVLLWWAGIIYYLSSQESVRKRM
jgi:hypothetical protein